MTRSGFGALGASSMPPSERRSPWRLVLAALSAAALFVLGVAVAAYATRDATSGAVRAPEQPVDPLLAFDEPQVDGTSAAPSAVLRAAAPVVERCFASALAFDPSLGGVVEVRVVAGAEAKGAATVTTTGVSPIFASCVARQGSALPLPRAPAGAVVEGRFTLDAARGAAILDEASAALTAP